MKKSEKLNSLVSDLETYLRGYVALTDSQHSLPLALWILGTYCFESFDAFPYLVITSGTKRSGKTRLSELIGFSCSKPRQFAAMTGPTLFRSMESEQPTLICDEAEQLSSETAGVMRSVLNVGYRKGQTIPRSSGDGIKEYKTYCPKLFVLIGDPYDTLRDRSIIITMQRAEPSRRFVYTVAQAEGMALRERAVSLIAGELPAIESAFYGSTGLGFLTGRDEEIWTPLFVLCSVFCPNRLRELRPAAADLATEKTAEARRYIHLEKSDSSQIDDEYAKRLITDLYSVLMRTGKVIAAATAVAALKATPDAPWRKYRGDGIDERQMAHILSRYGVRPTVVSFGSGRKERTQRRGYKLSDVEKGLKLT